MTHQERALDILHGGTVIPAIPLALTEDRKLDEKYQRRMIRYYLEAGSGGVAAAVLAIGVLLGLLSAKRKIKKGIDLYED